MCGMNIVQKAQSLCMLHNNIIIQEFYLADIKCDPASRCVYRTLIHFFFFFTKSELSSLGVSYGSQDHSSLAS